MWETVVPALSVLAAEAVIRRKINALPPKRSRCASGSACSCAGHIIAACCAASLPTGRRRPPAVQTASAAVLASMTAVCVFRRSSAVLQVAMGLMLGGALANLVERWARGAVTDYVYLPRAVIPFFRRIIWNVADLSVFAGCLVAIGVLLCEAM